MAVSLHRTKALLRGHWLGATRTLCDRGSSGQPRSAIGGTSHAPAMQARDVPGAEAAGAGQHNSERDQLFRLFFE